jgi:hypothetical protein
MFHERERAPETTDESIFLLAYLCVETIRDRMAPGLKRARTLMSPSVEGVEQDGCLLEKVWLPNQCVGVHLTRGVVKDCTGRYSHARTHTLARQTTTTGTKRPRAQRESYVDHRAAERGRTATPRSPSCVGFRRPHTGHAHTGEGRVPATACYGRGSTSYIRDLVGAPVRTGIC